MRNYGWRLYRHFFKTYNEKVWGVPASELSADWGAQRIKGMSLWNAVWEPVRASLAGARRNQARQVTSLIEEFHYPKFGPGLMWERCAEQVEARGAEIRMSTAVTGIHLEGSRATSVTVRAGDHQERLGVSHVISSMPLTQMAAIIDPAVPPEVRRAAEALHYRDFLTVALVVPEECGFPDNWIYVHSPDVKVGRIQNFGSWSPAMVKDGRTCLGLEYFVFEGDELWRCPDEELVALATKELASIGLVDASDVEAGYVVRMPKAYPVYDEGYSEHVEIIRRWLDEHAVERAPGGPQRHAQVQQPGPLDVHGHAHRREHPRCRPRHLVGQRGGGVPRGGRRAATAGGAGPGRHPNPTGRDAPTMPRRRAPVGNAVG